jgi:zinc protease
VVLAWLVASPLPAFDLANAAVTRLDNGLTLLVLEDRTLPVVSVQMLYRAGARNEAPGITGVAHFMEHMAFRASEGFPETELASRIYAVGGEWHAYTWIDQTTYYETAPREELDLLLRIEADRMARLLVPAPEVEAERGAVLAELHGYENDPASVLYDAVIATSFLQHPYRYNTIGWESDVEAITRADLVAFYRRHYAPANAVLAVVGDVEQGSVVARVGELFGSLPGGRTTPLPRTREPEQPGARRLEIRDGHGGLRFAIAWRAPAVADPDWPAFLLLREVLGGGDGVNFQQEELGVPVVTGTRLAAVPAEATTFLVPTADPYALVVAGSIEAPVEPEALEWELEAAIAPLREAPVAADELATARNRLAEALLFDVQTTEDAAHQLAHWEGLGARELLLDLPAQLAAVTPEDLLRVVREWLAPERRTIGWLLPPPRRARGQAASGEKAEAATTDPSARAPDRGAAGAAEPSARPWDGGGAGTGREAAGAPAGRTAVPPSPPVGPAGEALAFRLPAGLPALVRTVPGRRTVFVGALLPAATVEVPAGDPDVVATDDPVWRHTWLGWRGRAEELPDLLARARTALDTAVLVPPEGEAPDGDPAALVAASLRRQLGIAPRDGTAAPVLLVVAGDVDSAAAAAALGERFGDLAPGVLPATEAPRVLDPAARLETPRTVAQTHLGWAVPATGPTDPDHAAWRMLLYVLTHGYEGRLGVEAIARRGLLYWVGSSYHSDGRNGWIELSMGVDPETLGPLAALLRRTLEGLSTDPPSDAELAEARRHLLGRRVSAHQSPEEIAAFLAAEWVDHGRIRSPSELEAALAAVSGDDVRRILPAFTAGALARVEVAPPR